MGAAGQCTFAGCHIQERLRRLVLVVFLAMSRKAIIVIEQPATSLCWQHPRLRELLKGMQLWQVRFRMAELGAPTAKPTMLLSNCQPFLATLLEQKRTGHTRKSTDSQRTTRVYNDKHGHRRCHGLGEALKRTQSGTKLFVHTNTKSTATHFAQSKSPLLHPPAPGITRWAMDVQWLPALRRMGVDPVSLS